MTSQASASAVIHHVALVTADADNLGAWYHDLFGMRHVWTLVDFSELTMRRLPGIRRIDEWKLGSLRIHLLEVPSAEAASATVKMASYQHICLCLDSVEELIVLRRRWLSLAYSKRFRFFVEANASEVVIDPDGVASFYALDPDGLEWEFTVVPVEVGNR